MNPRRPRSDRPSNRPFRGARANPSGGQGMPSGGGGFGGGSRRGRAADLPMLLGEPSPSLAKINTMNMAKLVEKIGSLEQEQADLNARLDRLNKLDPPPADKIAIVTDLLKRLAALHEAATKRLQDKATRKAIRDRGR